jgi:hypothetical protein
MTLHRLHSESRADLLAMYDERIAARDHKTALAIKLKIAQLDAIYLGSPQPEPEPAPASFETPAAVAAYLIEGGWKVSERSVYNHIDQRKLIPDARGAFTAESVRQYAEANLINNPQRAEKTDSDALTLEAKQLENRRLRMKVEQQEGTLINSEDVKRELENMLVSFRSRILLIPRKLSSQLAMMTDQHKVEEVLTRELRDTLTTLSQFAVQSSTFDVQGSNSEPRTSNPEQIS